MPIALSHQVKEGPAKILTVLEGEEVEAFDVKVVSSVPQKNSRPKKDGHSNNGWGAPEQNRWDRPGHERQPDYSGWQNNRSSHARFVNDSTSGYGVHIEWMLQEAGIKVKEQSKKEEAS